MLQIIFNEISAREMSALPKDQQMELLTEFRVSPDDLENLDEERFGQMERKGKKLFRFRSNELRIYFSVEDESVIVHRIMNRGTLQDFLFRSKLPVNEDEHLEKSKSFWEFIEEGERARRA